MNDRPPLGELELETLKFVAENGPVSVGEAAKAFGEPKGLARTTILTVMERLREKEYLTRKRTNGVYAYMPRTDQASVMKGLVAQFVERSLGGSLSPFVAYLAESGKLNSQQMSELEAIVNTLKDAEVASK